MLDKLHHALCDTHPANLKVIKQYAQWLRLRRYVNNTFYLIPQMHWVSPCYSCGVRGAERAHWV